MFVLLAGLVAGGYANAAVTFERKPFKLETDDPGSMPSKTEEVRAWRIKMGDRGTLRSLDTALGWRSDAMEACLRAAAAPAADAVLNLELGVDGRVTTSKKSGDDALAGCVTSALLQPLFVPVLRSVSVSVSVRWDPSTPPLPAPAALPVDREKGFGPFEWGASASGVEGMSYDMAEGGTTFMARTGEYTASVFGARTTGGRYAFGEDGLHTVVLAVEGSSGAYRVREALTRVYGASKWDTEFSAYYWRGETNILLYRVAGGDEAVVTLMNIERARASGLADRMPGDTKTSSTAGGRRLPKTYSAAPSPEPSPVPVTPAEEEPKP